MIRHSGVLRLLVFALLLVLLSGCSRFDWFNRDDPLETLPVEEMYGEAKRSLETGNNSRAIRYYRRLIARFPYGPYTEQSQLELAYAQYKYNEPEEALATINRFIRTYPTHRHIDYAYYLRGLISFGRENAFFDRVARLDMSMRDQGTVRTAFNDFAELIRRYPNSRYAADARQRMVYLTNQMARHEANVARYYLRREAYIAASRRAQYLIEHYPRSRYTGDALAIMTESYTQLGQDTLAQDSRRVLELNYPDHPYLDGDWPPERSWWRRLLPLGSEREATANR